MRSLERRFSGAAACAAFACAFALLTPPVAAQQEAMPACHGEQTKEAEHTGHGEHTGHTMHMSADAPPAQAAEAQEVDLEGLNPKGLDVELLDQDGNTVHFYSDLVKDKVVAMNFVFTTCTTVCPPMGASFGRLQKELGEHYGTDVHLISVSIDPVTDTPERLKEWGARFDAGDGWTLVTGPKVQVNQILKTLEVFTPDSKDHSPLILLGDDRRGAWQKAHGFTPPAKLANLLEGYLADRQAEAQPETKTENETETEERTAAL